MPLPPYIALKRAPDDGDRTATRPSTRPRRGGGGADGRAALHARIVRRLDARGVSRHFLTLHVGAGTFLPVKTEDTAEHRMHAEWGEISAATAEALNGVRAKGGRIVAVGTTSLRLLESAGTDDGEIKPFSGETRSSLRRAIGSAPSICCGPISICRAPRCSCWLSAFAGSRR